MFARNGIIIVFAAFAIGGAAGWFAAGTWGNCGKVELWNCGNVETANDGACRFAAAGGESKVTEAELAALRDKVASLKNELSELLAAKGEKSEADMRAKDGDGPQENSAEVSNEEAEE